MARVIKPLHDGVLVVFVQEQQQTKTGLLYPGGDKKDSAPVPAKVLAVGRGKVSDYGFQVPMFVKAGQSVLVPNYVSRFYHEGQECALIEYDQVLAIVEDVEDDGEAS